MSFKQLCNQLEEKIIAIYEQGLTLEDAEKLAAEFLYANLRVSEELKRASLNARMRKSGMKALRASLYLAEVSKTDKKPADSLLTATLDANSVIQAEQDKLDEAEVEREELERIYDVFNNAHIFTRGVSRGSLG